MPVKTQQGERHTYRMKPHKSARIQMARERLAGIQRTAKPIIQETGEGITFRRVDPTPGISENKHMVGIKYLCIHQIAY